MKESPCTKEENVHVEGEMCVCEETNQIAKILDAKYTPVDLENLLKTSTNWARSKKKTINVIAKPQKNI